jgi:hypothetical protein
MTTTTMRRDGPGIKRLRAAPNAETIRAMTIGDQERARREALARIEAEKAADADAIELPAAFVLGSAAQTAADADSAAPAASAPPTAARPVSARRGAGVPRAERLALAQAGLLPDPPDFTAPSHKRFRPLLAKVEAMVETADVEGLRAYRYDGFMGSSMRAVIRYRDLALIALEARARLAAAA